MDETPEQILARLQRHADSLRAAGALPRRAPPVATASQPKVVTSSVVIWEPAGAHDLLPRTAESLPRFGVLARTVAGQLAGVLACVAALVLWVALSTGVAYLVIGVAAAGFAFGAYKRVPLCGWCTIGLLVGLGLGRFS